MKNKKALTIFIILVLMVFAAVPAYAQLGQSDISSFTIQNVDTTPAEVTVTFITEGGTEITPTELNSGQTNPFNLDPGESFEIYVPGIPATQLPTGRYSVMVQSSAQVVAIANLIGEGNIYFNGSYSAFDQGATDFYLPAVVHNYFGWYSLISVQNVGSGPTDVTLTITCNDGSTGTMTKSDLQSKAAVHFDLETTTPTGFTAAKECNGSALIESTVEDVVVVDNQTVPTGGNTQSFSGVASGASELFAPALYHNYFGWDASINIRKLGSGSTTVNVDYSDAGSSSCNLTDAQPSCLLYMPTEHAGTGYFGATISATPSMDLIGVVNAANGSQAQTYNTISGGTDTVGIPSTMKSYFGWNTSFTCQNVDDSATTTLEIEYDGYAGNAYDTASLSPGETVEVFQPLETFLPNGHQGGATVTANTAGTEISCIVNFNNPVQMGSTVGDWSMSYNAFNK